MLRRLLFPVLLAAVVLVALTHRRELDELLHTLAQGRWPWVALAALLQVAYYVVYADLYRESMVAVGVACRLGEAFVLLLGSFIVNVVVPSAGAAGVVLFVDDAARRGQSAARATAGVLLTWLTDFAALAVVLLACLAWLTADRHVTAWQVGGTAILVALVAVMLALLFGSGWQPAAARRALGAVRALVAGLARLVRRPAPLDADWPAHATEEFAAVAHAVAGSPARTLRLPLVALAMHVLDAASLGALFVAFGQPFEPAVVITGYAFGILAWILSPIPQGIGVVEGVMTVVFVSLGLPAGPAAAITLAFRGLTFWLPMAIGALLLRRLRSLKPEGVS